MADIINQTNYEDQQNSEIDIEQAYQYYIKVIDAIRSRANISGNTQAVAEIIIGDINKAIKK